MGQPVSTEIDPITQLALSALDPSGKVSANLLVESGMHREVLRQFFEAFQPELKNLVGWKELKEFGYSTAHWSNATTEDAQKAKTQTKGWLEKLEIQKLSTTHAVQIYDGETLPPPAKDYRLFILRDGRLLHYAGGLYGDFDARVTYGNLVSVLEIMDKRYAVPTWGSPSEQPFIVIMKALSQALESAINSRKNTLKAQESLQENLQRVIKQVNNK